MDASPRKAREQRQPDDYRQFNIKIKRGSSAILELELHEHSYNKGRGTYG